MRALTDSEARVIAVLLSAVADRERERLRRVDLPRSTYHAARRRAYEEGWLRDRYVPDPSRFGWPVATFFLARPYADKAEEVVTEWAREPSNVVLWGSGQVLLGVFFHNDPKIVDRLSRRAEDRRQTSWRTAVSAMVAEPSIPVYFDFEGLWSHLSDLRGTVAYPHGLGGIRDDGEAPTATSPRIGWALAELLRRPFVAQDQGRAGHLVGPFGLPFSQQRMLAKGWVSHRVFLDPAKLPPYKGRSADQVYLISGTLRSNAEPPALFQVLTRECEVFPFLYVASESRLLIGALGAPPGTPSAGVSRRPVMVTLQEAMEGIEITQESASALQMHVDHRYDRLTPTGPAG